MSYNATLVLTILGQLRSVYDSAFFLDGKTTDELGVGDDCTRLVRKAEQLQRKLLATGYPASDDWLTKPCDIVIGPPDKNQHCSAWVAVDTKLSAIREQLRRAVLRLQSEPMLAKTPPNDRPGRKRQSYKQQRADFAESHTEMTWPEVAADYKKQHPEDKEIPVDPQQAADKMRHDHYDLYKVEPTGKKRGNTKK